MRSQLVLLGLLLPLGLHVQDNLPIKRVVLYKNGIGYFEHLGHVRGNQALTVSFTSGQLNDVLKSLTVLDLTGGRITGVAYESAAPIERQLGDLRIPTGDKSSLAEFLGALRGARLEVRNGSAASTGRLLSVERKTRISGGATLEIDYLSLIKVSGELHTTEISPAFSVRLLDRDLSGKVARFLDLVASAREPDTRKMVISTAGSGDRNLFVSYISEAPVWKTTYRIVLNSKTGAKPLLQGWAIVDNTVGQDWENVDLSLVAGAPQSFIQNLSQPYYTQRPVIPLPESMSTAPQTHEATLLPGGARLTGTVTDPTGAAVAGARVKAFGANSALLGATNTDAAGTYELESLPEGAIRLEVGMPGFQTAVVTGIMASAAQLVSQDVRLQIGTVANSVEVMTTAPTVQTANGQMATVGGARSLGSGAALGGRRAGIGAGSGAGFGPGSGGGFGGGRYDPRADLEAAARGQELGDLFEYKLKEPISIQKNRSALVPVVQSAIDAEKVSVWNEQSGLRRPQRALWITNSSGLTLDGGSFSVLEEETFAGEGIFEPIRPGEKRLASYATDLALNVSSKQGSDQQRVTRVRIHRGVMTHESELRETKTYTFRNEDSSPRAVVVEHPVRSGYQLRSTAQPIETTAAWMRFRLEVGAKQTAALVVEEARPVAASYTISDINSNLIATFVQQRSIDKSVEEALRKVLAQKDAINALEEQAQARDAETSKIYDDRQRLRENMKALKGSLEEKALVQRYVQQLDTQETRLEDLRKEIAQLEAKKDSAQAELDRTIEGLSFDVKL
ncbi:MAG TPA: carboxypeptidase regulatory-like domain-containing protein [Bryobacteraceae bacterium]|nr:carboxypeptidase regulatory-like domain-containing protein [Bryobacteraceae bacterium]